MGHASTAKLIITNSINRRCNDLVVTIISGRDEYKTFREISITNRCLKIFTCKGEVGSERYQDLLFAWHI